MSGILWYTTLYRVQHCHFGPNLTVFFIRHHFTCFSFNLIDCISCNKCGLLYIGETGRSLRVRFGEHRRSVNNHDNTKPVATHFTSGSHCVSDMKIRALCSISGTNDSRKRQVSTTDLAVFIVLE